MGLQYPQGYHFSAISGNPVMSGNLAKVREKAQLQGKVGRGRGICIVREIWLWQLNKITYLYFIRTVINF